VTLCKKSPFGCESFKASKQEKKSVWKGIFAIFNAKKVSYLNRKKVIQAYDAN